MATYPLDKKPIEGTSWFEAPDFDDPFTYGIAKGLPKNCYRCGDKISSMTRYVDYHTYGNNALGVGRFICKQCYDLALDHENFCPCRDGVYKR